MISMRVCLDMRGALGSILGAESCGSGVDGVAAGEFEAEGCCWTLVDCPQSDAARKRTGTRVKATGKRCIKHPTLPPIIARAFGRKSGLVCEADNNARG